MSNRKNQHEALRWLSTADEDLKTARVLRENGLFAPACFHAQQSGEKALQAIWFFFDLDPWGHSTQKLVQEFPVKDLFPPEQNWVQRAAALDRFYIPTRYPDGLPDLTPGQSYFQQDADGAIENAAFFLQAAIDIVKEESDDY